jgi:hypothetical protein
MFEVTRRQHFARCFCAAGPSAASGGSRVEMKRSRGREDGASILEYVLLVGLVAMVCCGALLYLGRGSASPSHTVNDISSNFVSTGSPPPGGLGDVMGSSATGTAVKTWCKSGEGGCTDPMLMNGQTEIIHFWATGGTGTYTYQLQGSVPPFMIPDWPDHEITVQPTDCAHDPGTYTVSLVVSDSAGDTGKLNFTLNVAPGSLCQT